MGASRSRRLISVVVGVLAVAVVAFLAVGLILEDSGPGRWLQGSAAQAPAAEPGYIFPKLPVTVDGDAGEWAGDSVFADVYQAGSAGKPVEAHLYLRYQCASKTTYALVLAAGDWPIVIDRDTEAQIKINDTRVRFNRMAWIDRGYDGSNDHTRGWEASFTLDRGDYHLWLHTDAYHDGESRPADSTNVNLSIVCNSTAAIDLTCFEAEWASDGSRGVVLHWETAWENDNAGFNVYRATSSTGPWVRLNAQLIPGKVPPGSSAGATYQWKDAEAASGHSYLYVLEDVNVSGVAAKHEPVSPNQP